MDQEMIDLLEVVKELPLEAQGVMIGDIRMSIRNWLLQHRPTDELRHELKAFEWKYGVFVYQPMEA